MVKALTEDTNAALNGASNALIVKVGNGTADKINLSSSSTWSSTGTEDVNGTTYSVYAATDGNGNTVQLYVDKSSQ